VDAGSTNSNTDAFGQEMVIRNFFGKMQQLRVHIKISSKMNTADIATKILPATKVSILSQIVLGLQNTLLYITDTD
jgi:hypothetical protein